MSDKPSWTDRLFGGFRKTSERLSENLAAAVASAEPIPEAASDPEPEPAPPEAPAAQTRPAPPDH